MKLRFKPIAKPVPVSSPPALHVAAPSRPHLARGGAINHAEPLGPRGKAAAMLRDHGVDHPGPVSIDHVSSAIHAHYDPVTIALALAQASNAENNGHSLGHHDRLHVMHHAAARRGAYADGGAIPQFSGLPLHPAIAAAFAAMDQRPHFDDGGGEGEGDGSARSGGQGSDNGGDEGNGHGSSNNSAPSGSAGGVGGFGGGSSDGYGGVSSGGYGGVGGIGGANDGYGAGTSSSGSTMSSGGQSNTSSGETSTGGVGGSVGSGGQSDASTSSPAASSTSAGVMGGAGLSGGSYGSATSGDVGSIGGSVGAPAAGGFSAPGAPTTGGFGSFGSTPTANVNPAGLSNVSPSASMMSGQTAQQSAASEASHSEGEAGEDGTNGLGGVTTAGAFGSFGPAPSGPYGNIANAQKSFGVGDGTTGDTPSSVAASNISGLSGLSPAGQAFGAMGMDGLDPGLAAASKVGQAGYMSGPGAYGLSTDKTPGFDNFNSDMGVSKFGDTTANNVTQSSLGPDGYTGGYGVGVQAAVNGNLKGPEGYVGTAQGLSPAVAGALAAAGQPATGYADGKQGYSPSAIGGMFSDIGDIGSSLQGKQVTSPYGTMSTTPMGPLNVGALGPAMAATNPSGPAPGINADGDPTSVAGVSALTIHGPQTEAATGTYDAPGTATPFGGITDQQAFAARQNVVANGYASPQDSAVQSGYMAQQNTPAAIQTTGLHLAVAGALAATGSSGAGPVSAPTTQTADATAPASPAAANGPMTVSPETLGDYTHHMQTFESNNNPNAVSPTGAYGLSQMTLGTWNGLRNNYPGLNLPATPQQATAAQQAAATDALTNENVRGLVAAGLTPSYAAVYAAHNAGIAVAKNIFSSPDSTPVTSVVPARTIAANPQVYGGMTTVGQLKGHLADIMGSGTVSASPAATTPHGYANYSPGAASGMDTTDPAAPSTNSGISPASTYSPGVGTPDTTQTVTSAAPYGISPAVQNALETNGIAATPVSALAVDTLGIANGIAVMNGPPSDPISSIDISAATIQAHPDLFAGVQTVGDLQAKIAAAAPTAGTTSSTVTTPGTAAAVGGLPGYSYSPGAASGLDSTDPAAQQVGISQPGVYNVSPLTVSRSIIANQRSTDAGFSPGAASGADTAMDPTTPDGAPAKHLSVPNWAGNGVAGVAAGSLLGPAGSLLGIGNTISGWMGGPTIGDGVNGILAHPGAPTGVTGGGDNSNQPGADSYGSTMPAQVSGSGTGTGNDPQATSTAPAPDGALPYSPPPLTIHPRHQYYNVPTTTPNFYNPLTDPAVARALAAMRS